MTLREKLKFHRNFRQESVESMSGNMSGNVSEDAFPDTFAGISRHISRCIYRRILAVFAFSHIGDHKGISEFAD